MRSPLLLLFVTLTAAFVGLGSTEEREPEPFATSSSGRIAFLRNVGAFDEPRRRLVILDITDGRERVVRLSAGYDVDSFSWSPNGRRLVFAAFPRLGRPWLYVVNADGRGLRKLRRTARDTLDPVWSPRGDKIAWDNHDDGAHAIWVMKANGVGARRLTPEARFAEPTWSPDGTRIAYRNLDRAGRYVMNADGSAKRRFTHLATQEWTSAGIAYRTSEGIGFVKPSGRSGAVVIRIGEEWDRYGVSRDGRTVVVWTLVDQSRGHWDIGVSSIGSADLRRLTKTTGTRLAPSLSPDGSALAFGAYPPKSGNERTLPGDIYVINVDGTGERKLTSTPQDESDPAWAPKP